MVSSVVCGIFSSGSPETCIFGCLVRFCGAPVFFSGCSTGLDRVIRRRQEDTIMKVRKAETRKTGNMLNVLFVFLCRYIVKREKGWRGGFTTWRCLGRRQAKSVVHNIIRYTLKHPTHTICIGTGKLHWPETFGDFANDTPPPLHPPLRFSYHCIY